MSEKSTSTGTPSTVETSTSGHFYLTGKDAFLLGVVFEDWLRELEKNHDIKVTSYNYSSTATSRK